MKPIALRPVWAGGVDVHLVEVEGDEQIGGGHRAAQVPGAGMVDGLHDELARLGTGAAQFFEGGAGFSLVGALAGGVDGRHNGLLHHCGPASAARAAWPAPLYPATPLGLVARSLRHRALAASCHTGARA